MRTLFSSRLGLFLAICLWLVGCVSPSLSGGAPQSSPTGIQTSEPTAAVTVEVTAQESVASASMTPEPTITITSRPTKATPTLGSEIEPKDPATLPTRPPSTPTEEIPISYPPLTITPVPTLPFAETETLVNTEYGVVWSVPQGWWELSDQVAPPSAQTLYWRVWSDQAEGAAVFSESTTAFPDGLLVLMVDIEPEGASPFPPGSIPWELYHRGYLLNVRAYEITGPEAAPFALRLGYFVVRSSYRYNLMLGCLPPTDGDANQVAQHDALCRQTWHAVSLPFGLCTLPSDWLELSLNSWQVIDNLDYDYSFEVPANWPELLGFPQQLRFISDPAGSNRNPDCPLPKGLVFFDFAANPPDYFGPNNRPDLEGYMEMMVGGLPAWMRTQQGLEGYQPLDTRVDIYVQGPEFWYTMTWHCLTPTDASEEDQTAFAQQCEAVLERILDSFQVLSP